MTAAAGVNYCYNNSGNQSRRNGANCSTGGDTFFWDAWHRMASANISGGSNTTYAYNGDGVRTKKTTGSTITEYFQDSAGGLPRVAADKVDTTWNYYVYGTGLIGKVGSDNVARYYHYDGTGHTRAITDSTGAVVERYDYDAFGALRNTPTGLSNDRRFTGEQHDAETAYTFLRARYYDPALGRFISKDPFDGVKNDPQTLNGYAYTGNNPVNRSDPSGKCPWCLVGAAFGGGIDLGVQLATNGGDFSEVNWASVGISAVVGASGVGLGTVVASATTNVALRIALNAAGGTLIGGYAEEFEHALEGNNSMEGVFESALLSGGLSGLGTATGEAFEAGVRMSALDEEDILSRLFTGAGTSFGTAISNSGAAVQKRWEEEERWD